MTETPKPRAMFGICRIPPRGQDRITLMTIRQHDDAVSRNTDTKNQSLNVADTKRVLATARAKQKQDFQMFLSWVRAVDPEAAKLLEFWKGSIQRASASVEGGGR